MKNMNLDSSTEYIFLVFIIIIIVIGIGYWINTSREGFQENIDPELDIDAGQETNTEPDITTIPQTTISNISSNNSNNSNKPVNAQQTQVALSEVIKNQLSSISDSTTKDNLNKELSNLQALLERYSTLDIPIVMNDAGKICSMWGEYSNGQYRQEKNQCLSLDNTNILKCLDASGTTSTCSNILSDGYISSKSYIKYQPMLDSATSKIVNSIPTITAQASDMNKNASAIITSLADRGSIYLQQEELVRNNNENMAYKKKLMSDNTEKMAKKQNETNINQNDFSSFMEKITNTDSITNIYYRIIIGLVITILIVGILNFLFSNILS